MTCPACPCPEICLGWAIFCEWALEGNADRIAHIKNRSLLEREPARPRPEAAAVLGALARVAACPHRRVESACGCAGAACDLKGGGFVDRADCLACLELQDAAAAPA